MTKLEQLPEYTESVLHGLTAGASLKHRILQSAAQNDAHRTKKARFYPVPVLCAMIVILLVFSAAVNGLLPVSVSNDQMTIFAAGSNQTVSPEAIRSFDTILNEKDSDIITRIEMDDGTVFDDHEFCAGLFSILKEKAVLSDDQVLPESRVITIVLKDGTSVQVEAYAPWITDGHHFWECRDFFDQLTR